MIKIICIGKVKENYLQLAILEYMKRISKYIKIEIIELPDYNYDLVKTIKEESNNILKNISSNDYNVLLDIKGEEIDSITLSKKINNFLPLKNNLTFVIGGSYGVNEEVKNKCDYHLSFSKMTFPHQLFRVLLLEQIYRSFKILHNEEYHK